VSGKEKIISVCFVKKVQAFGFLFVGEATRPVSLLFDSSPGTSRPAAVVSSQLALKPWVLSGKPYEGDPFQVLPNRLYEIYNCCQAELIKSVKLNKSHFFKKKERKLISEPKYN
jgi:hypothetical protein